MNKMYYATGKRKTSVASVWLKTGEGKILINGKNLENYFCTDYCRVFVRQPLVITDTIGKLDINVNVCGGGMTGQAGAVRHGISKALVNYNSELRGILKRIGFLRRDSREKERKKYGQKGARARFQFSKR